MSAVRNRPRPPGRRPPAVLGRGSSSSRAEINAHGHSRARVDGDDVPGRRDGSHQGGGDRPCVDRGGPWVDRGTAVRQHGSNVGRSSDRWPTACCPTVVSTLRYSSSVTHRTTFARDSMTPVPSSCRSTGRSSLLAPWPRLAQRTARRPKRSGWGRPGCTATWPRSQSCLDRLRTDQRRHSSRSHGGRVRRHAAIGLGPQIDTSALSIERRTRHNLEMARALSAHNRVDDALAMVDRAETWRIWPTGCTSCDVGTLGRMAANEHEAKMAHPRMAAGALFFDAEGRVLMVEPTYKDYWEIPGGYVETGESPLQAAVREVEEGLGITPPLPPACRRLGAQHWRGGQGAVPLRWRSAHAGEPGRGDLASG
ncbi:NUDIX domain-containing protein [Streptomyces sp. NPDC001939]